MAGAYQVTIVMLGSMFCLLSTLLTFTKNRHPRFNRLKMLHVCYGLQELFLSGILAVTIYSIESPFPTWVWIWWNVVIFGLLGQLLLFIFYYSTSVYLRANPETSCINNEPLSRRSNIFTYVVLPTIVILLSIGELVLINILYLFFT